MTVAAARPIVTARKRLSRTEYTRIAAHSFRSIDAVKNTYEGGPVMRTTYESVIAAAAALGLPLPAEPKFSLKGHRLRPR